MHNLDLDRNYFGSQNESQNEGEDEAFEFDSEQAWGEVFGELEVQEMAAELLSVSNERELNQFLGALITKASSAIGDAVRSPTGQALGGMLKSVAQKALPIAGAALGNAIVPGIGGAIGGKLASAAGSLFGLELEGLAQEERDFEVAKQFVRLGADATSQAIKADQNGKNAQQVAKDALAQAAQKFAPGLLQTAASPPGGFASPQSGGSGKQHGRWLRRGNRIVLLGV